MSAGHHSIIEQPKDQQGHDALLTRLLDDPKFSAAVAAYKNEDDRWDVPFLGGSDNSGTTIYFDRQFVDAIKAGKVKYEGKPYDPRPFIRVHESVEGAAIRLLHANYDTDNAQKLPGGHEIATWAERRAVEHAGLDWNKYQASLEPFIRKDEHERATGKTPPDLLQVPYNGTPQRREISASPGGYEPNPDYLGIVGSSLQGPMALTGQMGQHANWDKFANEARPSTNVEDDRQRQKPLGEQLQSNQDRNFNDVTDILFRAGDSPGGYVPNPKLSHKATQYGRGHANGDHCGVCKFFLPGRPSHCQKTADPMTYGAMGWCDKFSEGKPMVDLTADKRKQMPSSEFALSGKRFPLNDPTHQRLAIPGASRAYHAGNISKSTEERIQSEARAKLGKSPGGYVPNPQMQMRAQPPHMHALSIAAATHLGNAGHIPPTQAAQIQAKSRAALNASKKQAQPQQPVFGSLAPAPPMGGNGYGPR